MVSVYQFSEAEIIAFALVLIRLSAFVMAWPVFGIDSVPGPVKILFSLVLAIVIFPAIEWKGLQAGFGSSSLIWMSVREAFIGVAFGFLSRMFLMATQIAGDLISMSIGLSSAQMFNPSMGGQATPLDQLLFSLSALIYLGINGHHLLLTAIADTFRVLPMSADLVSTRGLAGIGEFAQEIISIGVRISAPVVLAILIINIVLGVLGKTVPQINVLITSLALNVLVGFLVLLLALPIIMEQIPGLLETSATQVFAIMRTF